MKHACGIDGDPGAVTPLDGSCAACDIGSQRVNDATAAEQAHWRPIVANLQAANAELTQRLIASETLTTILTVENEKLRTMAGKDLI